MELQQQIELIENSSLFDEQWYLETYPDVAKAGMPAAKHFARLGWRLGRNPSRHFHTRGYRDKYQDIARSNVNPLVHYLLRGEQEGRTAPAVESAPVLELADGWAADLQGMQASSLPALSLPQGELPASEEARTALQLEHTQKLLEHYFLRCQELEWQIQQRTRT